MNWSVNIAPFEWNAYILLQVFRDFICLMEKPCVHKWGKHRPFPANHFAISTPEWKYQVPYHDFPRNELKFSRNFNLSRIINQMYFSSVYSSIYSMFTSNFPCFQTGLSNSMFLVSNDPPLMSIFPLEHFFHSFTFTSLLSPSTSTHTLYSFPHFRKWPQTDMGFFFVQEAILCK